jgi:hypothetical protein
MCLVESQRKNVPIGQIRLGDGSRRSGSLELMIDHRLVVNGAMATAVSGGLTQPTPGTF